MTTILITAPFTEDKRNELAELGTVVYEPWNALGRPHTEKEMIDLVTQHDANVLIVEIDPVTRAVLEAGSLSVVGCCRAGLPNIDLEAARDKDVRVLRTPGRNAEAVAEYVVAMIIIHLRNIAQAMQFATSGEWGSGERPYLKFRGGELVGRTVVFHGFGAVARRVAELLVPFQCRMLAIDPFVEQAQATSGVTMVSAEEGYAAAEILSVHLPVTPETTGSIDARLLGLLPTGAVLVNSARAAVVDYDYLTEALREGRLGGAILDVYRDEPIGERDRELASMPNVYSTPHIAGATHEVVGHHSKAMTNAVRMILDGNEPERAFVAV